MGYLSELGRRFLAQEENSESPSATFASDGPSPSPPSNEPTPVEIPIAEENTPPLNTTGVSPAVMSGSGTATHVRPPGGRAVPAGQERDALIARLEEANFGKSTRRGTGSTQAHFCSSPQTQWQENTASHRNEGRAQLPPDLSIAQRQSTFFSVTADGHR
jgi:hypothetical protein